MYVCIYDFPNRVKMAMDADGNYRTIKYIKVYKKTLSSIYLVVVAYSLSPCD